MLERTTCLTSARLRQPRSRERKREKTGSRDRGPPCFFLSTSRLVSCPCKHKRPTPLPCLWGVVHREPDHAVQGALPQRMNDPTQLAENRIQKRGKSRPFREPTADNRSALETHRARKGLLGSTHNDQQGFCAEEPSIPEVLRRCRPPICGASEEKGDYCAVNSTPSCSFLFVSPPVRKTRGSVQQRITDATRNVCSSGDSCSAVSESP